MDIDEKIARLQAKRALAVRFPDVTVRESRNRWLCADCKVEILRRTFYVETKTGPEFRPVYTRICIECASLKYSFKYPSNDKKLPVRMIELEE